MTNLNLPSDKIARSRELASDIVKPVQEYVLRNTTDTVERATLRLLGADLATDEGVPTAKKIICEEPTACFKSVVKINRPALTLDSTISSSPGSYIGICPWLSFFIFLETS